MSDLSTWGRWAKPSGPRGSRGGVRARGGDVLVARITPCLENGKIAVVPFDAGEVGGSTEFIVLRARPNTLAEFVFLLVTNSPTHVAAVGLMTGTTGRQRVAASDLSAVPILVPPLREQHRIVDLMGAVDAYVAAADARVEAARTARTALLTDLLSTPGEDWVETTLGDVVAISSGGTPRTTNPDYWGGDLPWISGSTLYSSLLTDSEKRITKRAVDDGASVTPPGSILVLVRGMRLISEIRIGLAGRELAFSQDVKALIPKEGVHPAFLWLTLLSRAPELLAGVRRAGHGTGVLETSTLLATTVGIPSLQEQARIVAILEATGDVADCCERVATNARKIRTALLSDLLSGAHEIPSDYDQFIQAA